MRKIIIASIVVLMGVNLSILTDVVDTDVLTISNLEKAFAWGIELPDPDWDDDDNDDLTPGEVDDPYDCWADNDNDGINDFEGYQGVHCVTCYVCTECTCTPISCD